MSIGRVAHISTWNVPCGIASYCKCLIQALQGFDIDSVVVPIHPAQWKHCIASDIADWEKETLAKVQGVDLVHIQHEHGLFGYSIGKEFALKRYSNLLKGISAKGIPCVTTFHTEPVRSHKTGWRKSLSNWLTKRRWKQKVASQFRDPSLPPMEAIVHSLASRRRFALHGIPSSKLHVFDHPCFEPRQPCSDNSAAKTRLGLSADTRLISLFGFVGSYKGHDSVIEALKELPRNYHFAIVGGSHPEAKDDYLNRLLKSVPRRLASRVRITGFVDQETAEDYFKATDVCVAPYRDDTGLSGSGAVTWGLSSGRPVIASKIEAFLNINREADCLFLVTPSQVQELAWAIQKVDTDEKLKTRLLKNAQEYCLKHSWESAAQFALDIYQKTGGIIPSSRSLTSDNPPRISA